MRRTKTVTVGEVLQEFFRRPYVAAKLAEGHLPDYWREIVGERIAANTLDIRLENHILHIRVASSIVRQELFFRRDMLLDEINRRAKMRIANAIIIR